MLKIELNFFDSTDPLVKFVEQFDSFIEHGVLVYGSYVRERFVKGNLHLTINPRDIDIIILRENGNLNPDIYDREGIRFDVHQIEIGYLWNAIREKRDPKWIQNLFTSALIFQKTEAPMQLMTFVNELRKVESSTYLHRLNLQEQFLIMQNFIHKIKSNPYDVLTFAHFFYPMIQSIYYSKCLHEGVWPHMHPPRVREEIKLRYPKFDKSLSEIESDSVNWIERAKLIETMVLSEMRELID